MGKGPTRGVTCLVVTLALMLLTPAAATTTAHKRQVAASQFETAERLRESLNGRPASERTRREYQRVIDAYRRVYYTSPISSKADASVVAVAELLAEMGRALGNPKVSQAAIIQYEFLRREYPGSRHRVEALFTIGQIYRDDLEDNEHAKATFEEFLKRYSRSRLADDARDALREIAKATAKPPKKEREGDVRQVSDADPGKPAGRLPLVTGIRQWSTPDYTRVAIDLEKQVKYQAGRVPDPDRIFFDLYDTRLAPELVGKSFDVEDGFLHKIRVAQYKRGLTRVVLELDEVVEYSAFFLPNPGRLIIDIHGKQPATTTAKAGEKGTRGPTLPPAAVSAKTDTRGTKTRVGAKPATGSNQNPGTSDSWPAMATSKDAGTMEMATLSEPEIKATSKPTTSPTFQAVAPRSKRSKAREKHASLTSHEAKPTAHGEQTLIRALGLKIGKIVVDAGHGGHDTGTIGPDGLTEKALVLDVALRLGKLLENRMGAEVVYTRDDDTFVPLETRTAIANKEQADLFISIHANSSRDPEARGVETYYLNFTSSADALEVAARENAVSEKSIHELQDLVKKIALKEKIEESREFAADVQQSLWSTAGKGTRNRGVKKAPFIVLIGANMPSILAEISFLSNPGDEHKLETPEYRQKIAEALYRGLAKYVSGLSGLKMAAKMPKDAGQ
ncbi:MAG TPA: N-acetylmuramoyl-L-alanine amidase [Terriglobales bacterium]|nr:N-acetylmuramoyl-L-alanine amidase [Terriglobales bacterium]